MNNFLVTAISQLTSGTFDSFVNVTIASTVLGKNVKASKAVFLEKGEQNGVSKATLNDVWGLAGFFANPDFVRYADVKNAPVSVVTLRLEKLGLTKLQHCKEYRALCNDKENLLFSLQTLNGSIERSDVTTAITNVEGLKAFITPISEWQITAVETKNLLHGYEKLESEKLAAEKLAAEKLAAEKLAAEKLAAEKLAAEKLAAEKLAAEKLAASDTDTDTVNVDLDFEAIRASVLKNLTANELLDIAALMDNDSLAVILKGVQALMKVRNKKVV